MKRRDFLKKSLAAAGGAAFSAALPPRSSAAVGTDASVVTIARADAPGGFYTPNRAPLAPTAFLKLPVGSIKPQGWLQEQLALQVDGLCGRYPEVSDYLQYDGNGWVDPNSTSGWEEVTYWLRGLADLGYVTGDARVTALANKWLTGMIASQQPDGWFGPKGARTSLDGDPDFWPHMPVLYAIRSYHEVTGDPKVIPFLTNYFRFQNQQKPEVFGKSIWASVRWGDNIDSIYWLYNRTGDAFLIDLVNKIHTNSYDWTNGPPNLHNVNFAQGFREPAQYGLVGHDPNYLAGTERQYRTVMGEFGQMAGGGFAGDENARPGYRDPRQGFETCGIAEYMLSFQILTRLSGDPKWMDRCEELAFNMLPAAYDPQQKSLHYITSMNSVQIDNTAKGKDFDNDWPMQAFMPGVHNYRCCPHNYGMAWPYYTENLWHATADKGLAANLYAASTVTAKVGDGTAVTIMQATEYPFGDTINLSLKSPKSVAFPLYLRIPHWCNAAIVRVNGKPVAAKAVANSYLVVHRNWKNADTVTLHLPMDVRVRRWTTNQNAVSVDRGPITYSLAIGQKWDRYAGTAQWPEYAVYPQSAWNYGLVLDAANPSHSFDVVQKGGAVAANPFTHETAPIELRAKARKIPNWQLDSKNVITPLQPSPVRSAEATETVSLIPMGAAHLRLTSFPTIGSGPDAHDWIASVTASASHEHDVLEAMSDASEPAASHDQVTPRFTWWDHLGTAEWVEYDLPKPQTFSSASVYWFDDTGSGQCRVPQSWRLTYKDGDTWKPVQGAGSYGTAPDVYNHVTFTPVTASALRLEVQLQNGFSGGVLRWRVK